MLALHFGVPLPIVPPEGVKFHTLHDTVGGRLASHILAMLAGLWTLDLWRATIPGSVPFGIPTWSQVFIVIGTILLGNLCFRLLANPHWKRGGFIAIIVPVANTSFTVQYLGPMSRNRFLLARAAPLLGLTVLPYALAAAGMGQVGYLSWISVFSALGTAFDLHALGTVGLRVPASAWVLESGRSILWGAGGK